MGNIRIGVTIIQVLRGGVRRLVKVGKKGYVLPEGANVHSSLVVRKSCVRDSSIMSNSTVAVAEN